MPPKPIQKAKARHEAKKKDEKIKKNKKKDESDSDEESESEDEEPKRKAEKKIEKVDKVEKVEKTNEEKSMEAKLLELSGVKQSLWNEVGKLEAHLANVFNKYIASDGIKLFNFQKVSLMLGD